MRLTAVFPLLLLASGSALADPGDPPARVARLNFANGSVSFRPAGVDRWSAATPNDPLITGDNLWVDIGSRAELHIGSTAVRLNAETAMGILNLDDRAVQLSLTDGSLDIRLRSLDPDESFEVDTPNMAIVLLRPGEYRVDASADRGVANLTVRSGEAEVTAGGRAFPVRARQVAMVSGADGSSSGVYSATGPDEFDLWSQQRDAREDRSASVRYVGREMTGYEDLDEHGVWRELPPYGPVWTPAAVAPGWAPYRYGHWRWVEPWGWTWVDDAPWGFAPFHYGRWACSAGVWFWVPGAVVARPVYAPALVAFVGGPHFSLSVSLGGGGGVAWFPLGPHEVYRPAYHVSETYVRNVNVTHVTNITNVTNVYNVNDTRVTYVNRNVQGAMTAVPRQVFVGAQPVSRAAVVVPARDVAQAQVVGMAAPVAPRVESVAPRAVAGPPARFVDRQVVYRSAPPAAAVPFSARQQALESNPGRPVDPVAMDRLRATVPPRSPAMRSVNAMPAAAPQPPQQPAQPIERPMRSERPVGLYDHPAPTAPASPAAQPAPAQQPPERPSRNDRPAYYDRPANAAPSPSPAAQPAPAPQPQERPSHSDRPGRGDHPGNNAPTSQPQAQPATQQTVERPQRTDRPAFHDRPANNVPASQPQSQPSAQSVERPQRPDRPVHNADRPPEAQRPEARGADHQDRQAEHRDQRDQQRQGEHRDRQQEKREQ